jgi:hypothetical protein
MVYFNIIQRENKLVLWGGMYSEASLVPFFNNLETLKLVKG